jgi:hypothetical protein
MADHYAERARVSEMATTRFPEDNLAPWLALHHDKQDEFSGEKVPNDCSAPWPSFSRWRAQGGRSVWRNSA